MLVPESVRVPPSDFVTVPVPVAIAPDTVVAPAPANVTLTFVPDTPPDNVSVEASETNVVVSVTVTRPEIELSPAVLRSTPFDDTPVPTTDIASVSAMLPESSSAAPLEIVVDPALVPRDPEFVAETTPA